MKNSLFTLIALTALSFVLFVSTGCKEDPPKPTIGTFELNFVPTVSGQSFESGVIYENVEGRSYMFEKFKMYVSNISLIKEDGTEVLLSEVELFDIGEGGPAKTSHGEGAYKLFENIEAGRYQGIKFGIGVPSNLNDNGPGDYPTDHPLGLNKASGMYWTWATGYRFILMEGRIDSSQNMNGNTLDLGLAYHTGLNSLYRPLEYIEARDAFEIKDGTELQFIIELDVNRMFYNATDTIDMVDRNITHTTPEGSEAYDLAEEITDNLINEALYKRPF